MGKIRVEHIFPLSHLTDRDLSVRILSARDSEESRSRPHNWLLCKNSLLCATFEDSGDVNAESRGQVVLVFLLLGYDFAELLG